MNESLAGMKPLEEVVRTIIATAYVEGSIPISAMFVSQSGAGKSKTILRFRAESVLQCDDLTSSGLFDILQGDKDNKIKFILIPDFNPVLSHKSSVSGLLVANLLSVTQDGTARIADGRSQKEVKHDPVGVITAVTNDMFSRYSRKWAELGITRRIIPLHYTYSLATITQAQSLIRQGKIAMGQLPVLPLPKMKRTKVGIPVKAGYELMTMSTVLAMNLGQYISVHGSRSGPRGMTPRQGPALLPMSPHLVLSAVAKSSAILNSRKAVNTTDIKAAMNFCAFTNMIEKRNL